MQEYAGEDEQSCGGCSHVGTKRRPTKDASWDIKTIHLHRMRKYQSHDWKHRIIETQQVTDELIFVLTADVCESRRHVVIMMSSPWSLRRKCLRHIPSLEGGDARIIACGE